MANKIMYIHTDETQDKPSIDWNKWLELNEPTNQNSIKFPKVVDPTNKKTLL